MRRRGMGEPFTGAAAPPPREPPAREITMAKKTTFTVTAPDGSVLTRTSENRTYTHAIIARPNYERAMDYAAKLSKVDAENYEFHVAMANGSHRLAARPDYRSEAEHSRLMACHTTEVARAPNAQ